MMCDMCVPPDVPSAADLFAEELRERWGQQTCYECGYDRAGCNCPDGKCGCEDEWENLAEANRGRLRN